MIFQTTTTTLPSDLQSFAGTFGNSAAWMLLFAGLMSFIWFISEGFRRGGFMRPKKEEVLHDEISMVLRLIVYLGIILGIIIMGVGVITIYLNLPPSGQYQTVIGNHYDLITSIALIVMGFAMFIKPVKDIPWATLIGIGAGALAGVAIVLAIPSNWMNALNLVTSWNIRWVYAIIFIIVATVVGLFVKFWFAGLEMVSKFISWPPVALILGILCVIQALDLLIFGHTLWLVWPV